MTTPRLFKLGNAQAVRIPARFRIDADEVEVFKRGDEVILRPKPETAAEMFARIRAKHGTAIWDDFQHSMLIARKPMGASARYWNARAQASARWIC